MNKLVQLGLLAFTIAIFVLFMQAYGPRSCDCAGHAATWRDAPGATEYGPLTGVVWTEGLEGATYHRLLCPKLGPVHTPRSRRDLTGLTPCELCEGGK